MNRPELKEMIEACYAARRREDPDQTVSFFASNATFRVVANNRLGELGEERRGHNELLETWRVLFAMWDWTNFPIKSVIIDDSNSPVKAVVHSSGPMTYTPTGETVEFETLDLLTIADGKIIDFLEFLDTHQLADIVS